jgi:hypothetical protein
MSLPGIGDVAKKLHAKLAHQLAGPLLEFLPDSWIQQALEKIGHRFRETAFSPRVMLWAFIGQVLDPDHSCNRALAAVQSHRAALGLPAVSCDTGGYCKARQRLPEALLSGLCQRVGEHLAGGVRPSQLWFGRHVKVVDGSSASMPDTPANQTAYPQPSSQAPGCGCPLMAFVAVFCLATGAMLRLALGPWWLHDLSLFYFVRDALAMGDIFLADRGFCSYAEMALLKWRGVDSVLRMHQRRRTDFRRGRALALDDHIVTWHKPEQRSRGLRQEDYDRLPATLTVRELRYRVQTPGFRTREVTLATTLLDGKTYCAEALAELYFSRWDVEVDFRHIKTTLQMDVLRGQAPAMVRKEVYAHMLAYNLIRSVMWKAARSNTQQARQLSFKGTVQYVRSTRPHGPAHASTGKTASPFLRLVAQQIVPYRPDRVEPRVRKRRPKNYPLMTKPRAQLKAAMGV